MSLLGGPSTMELKLQPSNTHLGAGGRLPWAGAATASAVATAPPALLPGAHLDDRHGIIRAVSELLAHVQVHASVLGRRAPCRSSPRGPRPGHVLQRTRRWSACCIGLQPAQALPPQLQQEQRRGHATTRRGRHRTSHSPAHGSTATASVSVAAGEVAQQAGKAASRAGTAALRVRPLQQLLAGGVAGAVSKTLVAPLERISTMLMTDGGQRFGVGEAVSHALRDGGVAGLWRGNAATLAKIFPASAVQFGVFYFVKDSLLTARAGSAACAAQQGDTGELSNAERLVAGAAAGAASVALTYPLESTRTLMSVAGGMEGSLVAVCRRVVANGGVRALYRGFHATLVGDIMGNALGFTLYEIGARLYKDMNGGQAAPPSVRGVIGALSAACTMTLTMPLEVVRRRLQVQLACAVQGTLGRPVLYRGTLDCMRQICAKEGVSGFYRASLPSYLKVAPSIGVMYFLFEVLTKHLASPTEAACSEGAKKPTPLRGRQDAATS